MGLFSKNKKGDVNESSRDELIHDSRVMILTLRCLQQTLDNYINTWIDEEFVALSNAYSLKLTDREKEDALILLIQICHSLIVQTLYDKLGGQAAAQSYVHYWYELCGQKQKRLEMVKHYQEILKNECDGNLMMLFPLELLRSITAFRDAANSNPDILTDKQLMKISAKAVSFAIDLTTSICKSNPILDAMIGVSCVESSC